MASFAPGVTADAANGRQDVEPIHPRLGLVGKATHLGECREVGGKEIHGAAAGLDVGDDPSASFRIAAMHQHARAGLPEFARVHFWGINLDSSVINRLGAIDLKTRG